MATKLNPINIPGLAQGKIILKNLCDELNPKLLPRSTRPVDWLINDVLDKI